MHRLIWIAPALLAGCAAAAQDDFDRLRSDVESLSSRHAAVKPGPATDAGLDARLSQPLDLAAILSIALDRNPEVREAAARSRAAIEEVYKAGRLDDPMLKLETEGVPLRQPGSFNRAEDNMLGLSQAIPFPGNLSLRSEAALRDAQAMREMARERERDLVMRAKKAYFELYALSKERDIRAEHAKLLEQFEKVSDIRFRNGQVSQQDVLKPQVELVMLHTEVLMTEQKLGAARARLNQLLHRPADAPLGEPRDLELREDVFDAAALTAQALAERPEMRAAELRAKATRASLDLARREATLPDFAVGVDWWQVPDGPDAWGGMFSVNLPWFTGKRRAEVRKLEHTLRADEIAVERVKGQVMFEVREALLRVEAARKTALLYQGELLSKSAQSVEVSRAAYEKGIATFLDLLDGERSLRDVRLRTYQALAEAEAALADLERAVGGFLK
jgi:outer membrane protein TolC